MPTYSTTLESSLQPQKILLVRFSSIGDIVFATAAIEAIARQFPECGISFLTLEKFSPLLESHPHLSSIIPHRSGSDDRLRLKSLASALELENFDRAFDLHDSLRSKYLRSQMKSVNWKVLRKPRFKRFLQFYLHIDLFGPDYDPILSFLNNDVVTDQDVLPSLHISHEEKLRTRELLNRKGVSNRFVVFIPSAAWSTKVWPVKSFRFLAEKIVKNDGISVVILGGTRDTICRDIAEELDSIVNLQGETDLRDAMSILSLADKAVGSDTGLLHAAEALGTPIVLLSGPTGDSTGGKIRRNGSAILRKDLWCQPCSKSGSRPCYRKDQFCLTEISMEKAWECINQTVART